MLKKQFPNTKFKSELRKFLGDELLDIIIFGSSLKGKENPKDIDLLLIYSKSINFDLSYDIKKKIAILGHNVDITNKTYADIFSDSFIAKEGILDTGFSIVSNEYLSKSYGFDSYSLFRYELKGFSKSNRIRFYYALYGRQNEGGVINELNLQKFSDSTLLCPKNNTEKLKEFLNFWKIKNQEFPILVPSRLKSLLNN